MIPYIDKSLVEWFYWAERQVSGGLGFRPSFDLKDAGGSQPGPILPELIPPAQLRPVDEAIRALHEQDWNILVYRYGKRGGLHEQAQAAQVSTRAYLSKIHDIHCWIAGYIRHQSPSSEDRRRGRPYGA